MAGFETPKIVLTLVIILTLSVIQPCGALPSSSSWIWPSQVGPQSSDKTKDSQTRSNAVANTSSIFSPQPRALFTFGTSITTAIATQTRTIPSSAPGPAPSQNCTCVPFYHCDEGQVVNDGSGLIDIRIIGWPCRSVLEVCCRKPRVTVAPVPTIPSWTTASPTGSSSTAIPGFIPQCGSLNPNGVHARILGFQESEAQFGEYPWQAAILEQKLIAGRWVFKFICGAALIWPSVVLTAAHCVQGREARHLVIRLGEWDTQTTSEFLPYQGLINCPLLAALHSYINSLCSRDIWGNEIVIHPLYYSGALINDIALIFLQQSAMLSPHIDTICLPARSPQVSYDGTSCWATGWGKNAFGHGGQYQAILHEVELPLVPDNICLALLRNTSLGPRFNFHNSYLCAGGMKSKDSCVGDGGGPMVCPSTSDPWRYVLAGITSWGVGCGTYGVPGVYVRVSEFVAWIEAQVSLRVPAFNPRQIPTDSTNSTVIINTKVAGPQQYI